MATATKQAATVNADLAQTANELITWMSEHGKAGWVNALKRTEGGQNAVDTVVGALEDLGLEDAIVFLGYGTGALKQAYDGEGENLQEAIVALKEAGRLMQFGRGRGYALILLDDTPLQGAARRGPRAARATDTAQVAKAPRAATKVMPTAANAPEQLIDELRTAVQSLRNEYETEIGRLRTQVQEMNDSLQARGQTTWA